MVSKKYFLLAGFFCLVASCCFAQVKTGGGYDVTDSSVVPSKRMPQHTEFLNGTYNFPAKPRNQWEIGIKGGMFRISGDVASQFAPGFGLHVRKAFGYVFSMRLGYTYGIGKGIGLDFKRKFCKEPSLGCQSSCRPALQRSLSSNMVRVVPVLSRHLLPG